MAQSTGPILAIGAITLVNASILHGQPVNWRIPVATAGAAMLFALGEQVTPVAPLFGGLAWLALATVLLVRVDPKVPSPSESLLSWWNSGK
jgi:hypothetical protein